MSMKFRLLMAACFCLFALLGGSASAFSAAPALAWLETQYSVPMLEGAMMIAFSPDNKFLYVASFLDDAVTVLARNPVTGALIFVESQIDDGSGPIQDLGGAACSQDWNDCSWLLAYPVDCHLRGSAACLV